jgi:SOS-response transcriptional repressor LexA
MRQWVIVLNTGRFGDWVVVDAEDEQAALKKLTRAQKRKVQSCKPTYRKEIDG